MGDPPHIDTSQDRGDDRGASYLIDPSVLAWLGRVANVHISTIRPAASRGGHLHAETRESIAVMHFGQWHFEWQASDGQRQMRSFVGSGLVWIQIPLGVWHRVTNTGTQDMVVVALSNKPFDPSKPDAHATNP